MPRVRFYPSGTVIEVEAGTSVLEAAVDADETSVVCCGIDPSCGRCKMAVLEGLENLSPPGELEAQHREARGFLPFERLGCMSHVHGGDVEVQLEE